MKKYFSFALVLLLLSMAAMAQRSTPDRLNRIRIQRGVNSGSIVKLERVQLYQDQLRYRQVQRNARRDGIVTPFERRKVCKARRKTRNDTIRFRNNRLHR